MFVVYIQRRDSLKETWEETNPPEPYSVHENKEDADKTAKWLRNECSDRHVRVFVKCVSPNYARYLVTQ